MAAAGAVLLALTLPAAAPAKTAHKITVLDEQSKVLTTFSSATCAKKRYSDGTSYYYVHARSDGGGDYHLIADIFNFRGFGRTYDVELGPTGKKNPYVDVFLGGKEQSDSTEWASNNAPSYPDPSTGYVKFSPGGTLAGIAFGPAMFSQDLTNAIQLTGVVRCHKPKKK